MIVEKPPKIDLEELWLRVDNRLRELNYERQVGRNEAIDEYEKYHKQELIKEWIDGWDSSMRYYVGGKKEYGVLFKTMKDKLDQLKQERIGEGKE